MLGFSRITELAPRFGSQTSTEVMVINPTKPGPAGVPLVRHNLAGSGECNCQHYGRPGSAQLG
jgi:hypothetical protein